MAASATRLFYRKKSIYNSLPKIAKAPGSTKGLPKALIPVELIFDYEETTAI